MGSLCGKKNSERFHHWGGVSRVGSTVTGIVKGL